MSLLSELLEYQKKLDRKVLELQASSLDSYHLLLSRKIALVAEYYEFLNETKLFKYWTAKPIDLERLKEEFIDLVHFTLSLLWIYELEDLGTKYRLGKGKDNIINPEENQFIKALQDKRVRVELLNINYDWMREIYISIEKRNFTEWLGRLSLIGSWLNISEEEIRERYLIKWRENFRRLGVET